MTKVLKFYKKYGIYVILLVVFALFSILEPVFLSLDNVINILRQISMFGIVVVGVTFVMIGGGSDLSVGGQVAVNGMLAAVLMVNYSVPPAITVIICILVGTAFGALNGFIGAKLKIFPLVVTLCTMLILQGVAQVITGGYPIFGLPESFAFIGQGYLGPIPVPVILFVLIVAVAWFVLNKTYFGRHIYAVGGNQEASRLAGIHVEKMQIALYAICGFITSIGAMVMLSRTNSAQPTAASTYPFDCMTAACLGGITFGGGNGNILNSIVGVLIIGILNNGLLLMGVNVNYQTIIKGVVLLMAIAIDALQKKARV